MKTFWKQTKCTLSRIFRQVLLVGCLSCWSLASFAQQNDLASEKYFSANALFNKKLYDLASEEYKSFIARYPSHPKFLNAKLGLALSMYELGRYGEAEKLFAELSRNKNAPHQEQIHNLLGQCLLIANKPAEAEVAFRWSVNRGKERFFLELPGVANKYQESPQISVATVQDLEPLERSLAGLIESLYQQGKWKEVVSYTKELVKLVSKGPYSSRARFLSALANYELKNYKDAVATLNELVKMDKNLPYLEHIYFLQAECYRQLGKLPEAEGGYEMVSKKIKKKFTGNALFRLGYIKFMQKKYRTAIKDFTDLRAIYTKSPFRPQAGIYLGRCYYELGDYKNAQAIFGELTAEQKVAAEATLWLSKVFMKREQYNQAIDILKSGVNTYGKDPLVASLYFDYGNALMKLDKYRDAAEKFEQAVAKGKKEDLIANALRLRAFCLNRNKQYEASLSACGEFLKRFGNDPHAKDVAFLRSENLFYLDKTEEAIAAYKQFIPWEGKDKYTDEARYRMAQSYCEEEKWRHALSELEILINSNTHGAFYEQLYYLSGLCAFNLKSWTEAIDYFAKFVKENPDKNNADSALMKMAQAYAKRGDSQGAAREMERLIAHYPQSPHIPQALTELGKFQYDLKEYPSARQNLERVVKKYSGTPYLAQAEYYLGWIDLAENNPDSAYDRFKTVSDKYQDNPLAPDALFQQALIELKKNDFAQAQGLLKTFIERYKGDSRMEKAQFFYSLTFAKQKKYDQANTLFNQFVKDYPKSPYVARATYELAWCARELGNNEQALTNYNKILNDNPMDDMADQATYELSELEYENKRYDEAMVLLDRLLAKNVKGDLLEKVLYRMAWCYLGRDQKTEALDYFEKLLREFPDSQYAAVAAYQAGELRLKLKEFENAYHNFMLAVAKTKDPELREQALLRLGETQTLTERWKDAEGTFATFVKDFPKSEHYRRAKLWLGWSMENMKKLKDAIKVYQAILDDGKRDVIAARCQFQIGECYFELKDYDQAIKSFVKVELYSFSEWTSKAMLEMGQALAKKGDAPKACAEYEKVIEQFPGTDEANLARELLRESKVYTSN